MLISFFWDRTDDALIHSFSILSLLQIWVISWGKESTKLSATWKNSRGDAMWPCTLLFLEILDCGLKFCSVYDFWGPGKLSQTCFQSFLGQFALLLNTVLLRKGCDPISHFFALLFAYKHVSRSCEIYKSYTVIVCYNMETMFTDARYLAYFGKVLSRCLSRFPPELPRRPPLGLGGIHFCL